MAKSVNVVRFDWVIKRLLPGKADYVVVEGLLTVLLGRKVKIVEVLETKPEFEPLGLKYGRADLYVVFEDGEHAFIEIKNDRELDYFHRMTYGTSKALAEYMKLGDPYEKVRKVYSINIVYFSLGQGNDYAYHGVTKFVSMHDETDELQLSAAQRNAFQCSMPSDIFPEYYLLRVDKFDTLAKTPLDEWIDYLKTGDIPVTATAPGLPEAREQLLFDNLSESEKKEYYRMMENLRYQRSVIETGRAEGREEGREEGYEEGRAEGREEGISIGEARGEKRANFKHAKSMKDLGLDVSVIAQVTGLSVEEIDAL